MTARPMIRWERAMGYRVDPDMWVSALADAYKINGRRMRGISEHEEPPDDADTPDVPRPHRCVCGWSCLARRDLETHQYECDVAVAAWSGRVVKEPTT